MASKTNIFTCRLASDDLNKLKQSAESFELTPSCYVRYLIRIPSSEIKTSSVKNVVAIDTKSMASLSYELIRWGRHYNQAVRALNTLAKATRQGKIDNEYFIAQIDLANKRLDEVDRGRSEILYALERIQSSVLIGAN